MTETQSIVFFDGVCNLCNDFVQFILKNEAANQYQFCSLQSDFATKFFEQKSFNIAQIDSVIVFENNQFFIESAAVFKIVKQLKWPYKGLTIFKILPKFINNFFYKLIAKYRYKIFGKTNVCWVMNAHLEQRFL